ncbi:restriction endonuclease subunit S [Spirosoma fluminis]
MENELPEGWEETEISNYYELVKEKIEPVQGNSLIYVGLEHLAKGGGIENVGDSNDVKSTKTLFRKGDVLYGKLRPYLNKHAFVEFDGVCSTDILAFRATSATSAKYLNYYLGTSNVSAYAVENSQGINLPRVSGSTMGALSIPLPPLAEQTRIVAKLDAAFAHLETLKTSLSRIPELLKKFRQTVLTQAVTGKLTGPLENRGEAKVISPIVIGKSDDIAPEGWKWWKLVDLAQLESGHTPRKSVSAYWDNGDVPWISLQDIRAAHGKVISETKFMPTALGIKNSSARLLPKGTVCFSRDISVGFTTIMGREMATTQHFANWICGPLLYNMYLLYAFMAAQKSLISSGTGTTVGTIYMPALKEVRILLPPLEEQKEIVGRVKALFAQADALEAQYVTLKAKIDKLPQALLAKAFRGELVPQDPADEPASVLLEKIKAATASIGGRKKSGQTRLSFADE